MLVINLFALIALVLDRYLIVEIAGKKYSDQQDRPPESAEPAPATGFTASGWAFLMRLPTVTERPQYSQPYTLLIYRPAMKLSFHPQHTGHLQRQSFIAGACQFLLKLKSIVWASIRRM